MPKYKLNSSKGTNLFKNMVRSIDDNSPMSVSSITLLLSGIISFLVGLTVCFILVYDTVIDGKVDTDIESIGFLLLLSGGYVASSGIPKTIIDAKLRKKYNPTFVKEVREDVNYEQSEEDDGSCEDET